MKLLFDVLSHQYQWVLSLSSKDQFHVRVDGVVVEEGEGPRRTEDPRIGARRVGPNIRTDTERDTEPTG